MGLADRTKLSRGVIWSIHMVIDIDLFQATCISFASESLNTMLILVAQLFRAH